MTGNKPKLSVCVVTYNQVDYIVQCLQSLVDQEVNFDFEIIVGDDCSSDGTRDVVLAYASKYPSLVRCLLHETNCGPVQNIRKTYEMARGEYIVHMDGDDYALPSKLKKQFAYMEANPHCTLSFHLCLSLYSDGSLGHPEPIRNDSTPCDLPDFMLNYPSKSWHSSKIFRVSASFDDRSLLMAGRPIIDKHLHFEHGLTGKTGFVNEVLGVYRVGVGISSKINLIQDLCLDSYNYALSLGFDEGKVKKLIAREQVEHAFRCLEVADYAGFKKNIELGYRSGWVNKNSTLAFSLRSFPGLYKIVRSIARRIYSVRTIG